MRETIGHYRLLDQIGAGAIGAVYRARDTRAGRTVAVKVLNDAISNDPDRRARFLEDARAAAAVSHPNIAALYEVGEEPDLLYLVSEFVRGDPLRSVIGGRPLNPRRAVDLGAQIADALAHAHAHGMAHGDLRPENIVITPKGSAKIMQPGFAAWAGPPASAAAGSGPAGDIASLGRVLFEMLTGALPAPGGAAGAVRRHPGGAPGAAAADRALPSEVERLLAGMLAASPGERLQSAAVVAAELRALVAVFEARAGQGGPPPAPGRRSGDRRSGLAWIIVAIVLCGVAALAWLAARL